MRADSLPAAAELLARWRALCILDLVLGDEPDYHEWDLERDEEHGAIAGIFNNGCGDQLYAHWLGDGPCVLWGFAHEAPMTPYREDPPVPWPGLLASLPERFAPLQPMEGPEPAPLTFAMWRADGAWAQDELEFPAGDDPDGSDDLLGPVMSDEAACERVLDMYELGPDKRDAVLAILAAGDANAESIRAARPDADVEARLAEIRKLPR